MKVIVEKRNIVFEHISLQDAEKPGALEKFLDELEEMGGKGGKKVVKGDFKHSLNDLRNLRKKITSHHRGEEFEVDRVIGYVFETRWRGEFGEMKQNKDYTLFYVAGGNNEGLDEEDNVVAFYKVMLRAS